MQLIVIHGPIASGKLTTAKELAERTGLALFHNHLVVDTVLSVFPFGSEPFIRLRDQFWLATFAAAAESDRSLIFTFAPEPTVPTDFFARVVDTVQSRGGRVIFIELQVSDHEQAARLDNADRKVYGKLTDVAVLDELRRRSRQGEPFPIPPADVVLDTGTSSPADSARRIATELALPTHRPHSPTG